MLRRFIDVSIPRTRLSLRIVNGVSLVTHREKKIFILKELMYYKGTDVWIRTNECLFTVNHIS